MQTQTPDEFFSDLVTREEAARLLNMRPDSLAVAMCRGRLPLTRYKRGRQTHYSKREIVAHLKASAIPAPLQAELEK